MSQQLDFRKLLGVQEDEQIVIAIGSGNLYKARAVMDTIERMSNIHNEDFWFEYEAVSSGVHEQPMGSTETFRGAQNRLNEIKKKYPNAHMFVGIEAGLIQMGEDNEGKPYYGNAQTCVISLQDGRQSRAIGPTYWVPDEWCKVAVTENGGMATVFEKRFGPNKGGTRPLTKNRFSRAKLIGEAVEMAIYGLNW